MAYLYILKGSSSWKPKYADYVGAAPFNIEGYQRKYKNPPRSMTKANVLENFTKAYTSWLQNVEKKRIAKNAEIMKGRAELIELARTRKRLARTPATPRRPNQVAAARHAGSVRSVSPRRRILAVNVNAARANARLTAQLQNVVNTLLRASLLPKSSSRRA